MEKIIKWCGVTLSGILLTIGVVGTLVVPVMATDGSQTIQPRNAVPTSMDKNTKAEIPPTFITEVDESNENVRLWMGKNLFIAGNNIKAETNATEGLMFAMGNNLSFGSKSEYGFVAGNIIKYSGATTRDLFIAGNYITLQSDAKIGRDTYDCRNRFEWRSVCYGRYSGTA